MLTVVCEKTRMICVFPNLSRRARVSIIRFILTTLKNEQHPCKRIGVDGNSVLEKSTDVTNLLIEELRISMELLLVAMHLGSMEIIKDTTEA